MKSKNYINAPDNKGIINQDSPFLGDDNEINQKVTTTPSKKNKAYNMTSWYNKPLFTQYIWPVLAGLTILVIAIVLANKYGLSS